jgi:nucleotide-binding universal stress UspA family protein
MKTILAALDGSSSAAQVLRTAADLARAQESRLVLLRVANLPVEAELLKGSPDEQRFAERIREETARLLEAQRKEADVVRAELRVEVGPAAAHICETARTLDADLIVLGALGQGVRQGALGQVTAQVLADTDRSVLVVRGRRA